MYDAKNLSNADQTTESTDRFGKLSNLYRTNTFSKGFFSDQDLGYQATVCVALHFSDIAASSPLCCQRSIKFRGPPSIVATAVAY